MRLFNMELVPFHVPFKRRLQTLGVCIFLYMYFFLFFMGVGLLLFSLVTGLIWLWAFYAIYYYYDFDRCEKGGFQVKWLREAFIWKYFCQYFPVRLIKTAELDPTKNYIMGVHPHGILAFGSVANFGTEGNGFSEKFPGITPHLLTLKANFILPIIREYNLALGLNVASKATLEWILNNKGYCKEPGQACVIVVGGAQESLDAEPGKYKLTVLKRKGFVKMALRTGASLVPVFSFGENDVYSIFFNHKDSLVRFVQEKFKKLATFTIPIFYGRGIFNYNVGMLPRRMPITTVIGKPIEVTKTEKPTDEEVDELHKKYIEQLVQMFNEYKSQHPGAENSVLELE